jgi:cytoskeleton protein RodZ
MRSHRLAGTEVLWRAARGLSYDDAVFGGQQGGEPVRPRWSIVGEFGDKFRKAREKKGVSLDDASNATKIGSRMLQAIEEEQFDRLPGGVFNKGFIRAYAKHLGLNDEEAVAEYLECLRQAQIEAQAAWQPPTRPAAPAKFPQATAKPASKPTPPATSPPSSPKQELPDLQLPRAEHARPPRPDFLGRKIEIPWRIVAVAALIIVLAVVLWNRHARMERFRAAGNPGNSSQMAQPAPNSASPAATPSAPPASSSSTPTSSHPQPPPSANPPPAAHTGSTAQQNPATQKATQATAEDNQAAVVKPPATAKPAPEPPALTLVIRASENTWISVSADGQTVSQETLIAPAETSVRAKREVVVRVGNAAGVSFLLNGKEIPPQGNESEVKTLVFDANGLQTPE